VRIDSRFQGPPRSGNGGYACGVIARRITGNAIVRLKSPPPLDIDLRLETDSDHACLYSGDVMVGEGRRAELDLDPPHPPSHERATDAAKLFLGFKRHQFPNCFVCGPNRASGDGLRIFPGPLSDGRTLAAPWVPDISLADESGAIAREFVWSALDCPSGFALEPLPQGVAIVLGELCASFARDPRAAESCVVVCWPIGASGRKRTSGSAIYGADGSLIAKARAVWIEIPLSQWQ
jgi:hypothetical protein